MTLSLRPLLISFIDACLLVSGCDLNDKTANQHVPFSTEHHGWPCTINSVIGPFTLEKPPQRIVSTSVTLTGTLLAIDAPVLSH